MPRQARLDYPGALHHVVVRGIDRKKIFLNDSDKEDLLERLAFLIPESQMTCYAWCLLPSQIHLLVRSGGQGLSHFMKRLLTGYVVHFNKKHKKQGPLFQNRFKSVLCQEDPYFKELVRFIHLQPLNTRAVKSMDELKSYKYSGHGAILGAFDLPWQDTAYVLSQFGKQPSAAKKTYRSFMKQGMGSETLKELLSGGLVKSPGGWAETKKTRKPDMQRAKGDERILGDYDFVSSVLSKSKEPVNEAYKLKGVGVDYTDVEKQASRKFGINKTDLYSKSRKQHIVNARSVFMFWANRKLGYSCTELARRFKITQPAVSYAVERGEKLVKDKKLRLIV